MLFRALSCTSGLLGRTQFAADFFADCRPRLQRIGYFATRFLTHRRSGCPSLGQIASPLLTTRRSCFEGDRQFMPRFIADWWPAFLSLGYISAPFFAKRRSRLQRNGHLLTRFRSAFIRRSRLRGLRHASARLVSDVGRLFYSVFSHRADPHVAKGVGPFIASTCHTILVFAHSLFGPHSAFLPDCPPFFERQQEWDAARTSLSAMTLKGHLDAVRLYPLILVISAISHWYLSPRTVVRDGSGVSAPVSSRLYHTQMQMAR